MQERNSRIVERMRTCNWFMRHSFLGVVTPPIVTQNSYIPSYLLIVTQYFNDILSNGNMHGMRCWRMCAYVYVYVYACMFSPLYVHVRRLCTREDRVQELNERLC